jgi:hypothetical protein
MKKDAARVLKRAKELGYEVLGEPNSKGLLVLRNGSGHQVKLSPAASDHFCREITAAIEARAGVAAAPNKRNTDAIKSRAARATQEAAAERARHQAVLDRIAADNAAMHERRLAADCTAAEWAAIARQLEANDRQARETRTLMAAPAPRDARAHHRTGSVAS